MSHLMFSPLYFRHTLYKVTSKYATVVNQPLRLYFHTSVLGSFDTKHVSHSIELRCCSWVLRSLVKKKTSIPHHLVSQYLFLAQQTFTSLKLNFQT